jgi:hypothetical protein
MYEILEDPSRKKRFVRIEVISLNISTECWSTDFQNKFEDNHPTGRRRLGRPLKVLLDDMNIETETGQTMA